MTMFRRTLAAFFLLLASIPAFATCGSENPNCIVVTRPPGDSTGAAASTAFVTNAISTFTAFPSPTRAGDVIYWNGSSWVTLPGNNSGTQFLQETSSGVPSWATVSNAGTLVSIVTYSGTQTITIPATATKAFVRMWGGTGGSGGVGGGGTGPTGGTGAAGYLEKYLTGLTPANTVAYTQGAAGAAGTSAGGNGGNGTASTLASGSQTITTLTANGSNGSLGDNAGGATPGTAGGTATNGDVNITGSSGILLGAAIGVPGMSLFSSGAQGVFITSTAGKAGNPGGLVVFWFT
jgi:hypothetical protein